VAGEVGAGLVLGDESQACLDVLRDAAPARDPAALPVGEQGLLRGARAEAIIEWLRLPGDLVFIVGGAIPTLYIAYLGIRHTVKQVTLEQPEDILFTNVYQPEGISAAGDEEAAAARLA
jgi:hypothetical protein